MFDNKIFYKHDFEDIPLDRDCYIMDEKYILEYESSILDFINGGKDEVVGYVVCAAVRRVKEGYLELSIYMDFYKRFHEISAILPKEKFLTCVSSWNIDEKPHIFVKSDYIDELFLKRYSVYGMIDICNAKEAIVKGIFTNKNLTAVRNEIDSIASSYEMEVAFISFADTLILKSAWLPNAEKKYNPEVFFSIFQRISELYKRILGLNSYAVFTQGENAYYADDQLHISPSKNHICLNSLGVPFADLKAIEETARKAIKEGVHGKYDIYMSKDFFYSLNFKQCRPLLISNEYQSRMRFSDGRYFFVNLNQVLEELLV